MPSSEYHKVERLITEAVQPKLLRGFFERLRVPLSTLLLAATPTAVATTVSIQNEPPSSLSSPTEKQDQERTHLLQHIQNLGDDFWQTRDAASQALAAHIKDWYQREWKPYPWKALLVPKKGIHSFEQQCRLRELLTLIDQQNVWLPASFSPPPVPGWHPETFSGPFHVRVVSWGKHVSKTVVFEEKQLPDLNYLTLEIALAWEKSLTLASLPSIPKVLSAVTNTGEDITGEQDASKICEAIRPEKGHTQLFVTLPVPKRDATSLDLTLSLDGIALGGEESFCLKEFIPGREIVGDRCTVFIKNAEVRNTLAGFDSGLTEEEHRQFQQWELEGYIIFHEPLPQGFFAHMSTLRLRCKAMDQYGRPLPTTLSTYQSRDSSPPFYPEVPSSVLISIKAPTEPSSFTFTLPTLISKRPLTFTIRDIPLTLPKGISPPPRPHGDAPEDLPSSFPMPVPRPEEAEAD